VTGKIEEIDIFETGLDGTEAIARTGVDIDANLMKAADKVGGDDIESTFERAELIVSGDYL
jgi:hypothetical protein